MIQLDENLVKEEIKEQVQLILKDTNELWLWDVETLVRKMCMSNAFVEEEFLRDPRMKRIELKKSRKRWYQVDEAKRVIQEIMNEW
ncbi:hypothetical protein [Carnobacterium sp.]|uniref:hypothetical protein n=1 Tax=Carnobacterium sp. TaxID=48221 RepID=UPI00388EBE09